MSIRPQKNTTRTPALLHFLTPCPFIDDFEADEGVRGLAKYSSERSLSLMPNGIPLYCTTFKSPPTSTTTPGKTIPAGYTSTGKFKPSRWTPSKTDKRAGK